jgi:RNA polymerase sigma-70 factor (ECF subfamily)
LAPRRAESYEAAAADRAGLDVAAIYAAHAQFLWKSLYRMGVGDADLPDAMQEVLLVVHRRLDSFDSSSKVTTWLFGICLRVAGSMRRSRRRRREAPMEADEQRIGLVDHNHPERLMDRRDAQRRLSQALDSLEPERRALLTLFEIDGLPCAEIAELLGVPVGTVHSRLAVAREHFQKALSRLDARRLRPVRVSGART